MSIAIFPTMSSNRPPPLEPATAPFDPIDPAALADLLLVSALQDQADVMTLRLHPDRCTVALLAGDAAIGRLVVPAEVGLAAAARIAVVAGLEPVGDEARAPGGVARVRIRAGGTVGDVLISMGSSARDHDVEIHPLTHEGQSHRREGNLKRCARCGAFQPWLYKVCDRDGGPLFKVDEDPSPGGTIGVYRIEAILGRGCMGSVFAAEHAFLARPVAIKVMHQSLADNAAMTRRFLQEARAASRLRHPNVVEVTDFGLLRDGRPFLVMEQLMGEGLDLRLSRCGALPVQMALHIARELARALEAAHGASILHNDLKPANAFLVTGPEGEIASVKLLDFGAASMVEDVSDGFCIGTPEYMAPERARGLPGDTRADLYALGVVLHEMLSGSIPLEGDTPATTLLAQIQQQPPPPSSPFGPLPPQVIHLVKRALAKAPGERPQSAREMIAELDEAIARLGRAGWLRFLP
jgi:tRNA A-37 threonylcarbamoyl transferase component Bud32